MVLAGAILALVQVSTRFANRSFDLGAYSSIQFVLNTNAAALASTLGILMAIVLLMVQLTAQRYSFNIIGMFVRNPRNVSLVVLFIITISFNLWLATTVDDGYIPQFGTYLALGMGTVCFGLLIPYFAYLFDTLRPHNLLDALRREVLVAVESAQRGRPLVSTRRLAAERVQHIGDITRTAIALNDADVARYSVWILYGTFCDYLERKPNLPRDWFTVEDRYFRGRHALTIKEIEESGTWLERRIFEDFQAAFSASLTRLEPVNNTVALCCRLAGERALELGDDAALELLMKFFNSFLRAALNAKDARAGYHLSYQYALLADTAFESRPSLALEIAHRISYYGKTALESGLYWMAVAAAQDLRTLAEASVNRGTPHETTTHIHEELLELVNLGNAKQVPVTAMLDKAVIALGAFHLAYSKEELGRDLACGLSGAESGRLSKLAEELAVVTEPQFWELTDRVVNFDYVDEAARAKLGEFLARVEEAQASKSLP